jgi:ATP-binding cassette subfamily F protein uup
VGVYDYWVIQNKKTHPSQKKPKKSVSKKSVTKQTLQRPRKLSFKEKKELQALPQLIETLETEQQQLHDAMADTDFYKKGADVAAAAGKLEELKEQLENAYARWQTLEELQS